MADHMTEIPGCPSKDLAKPGMAHFAGTGPVDKHCGDCSFRGYSRESRKGHWSDQAQGIIYNIRRVQGCLKFKTMTGQHGPDVDKDWRACRYFEQKPK